MGYLPLTETDRHEMLAAIGASSVDELFAVVPEQLRHPDIPLPAPLSEQELVAAISALAARNRPLGEFANFLGAGVYRRYIPALVRATVARPEFYSAYTPYQAEASQGTLQTIFEFQSMVCALTGLDVSNASLYDGATAAAEAAILACFHTGRSRVAVSEGVHPETLEVLRTFLEVRGGGIDIVPLGPGGTDPDGLRALLTPEHAALIVAQPSFFGTIEDLRPLADAARANGSLSVAAVDLLACSVLVSPGQAGIDIAIGDAQPLGIAPNFGGPHVGFMAVTEALLRKIPGRLVGMTEDAEGRRSFCLTLQTREQHIRREKATSNICTNHALMALAVTVYMAQMGAGGLRRIAEVSAGRAHRLAARLTALDGFSLRYPDQPYLWEFALTVPGDAREFAATLHSEGILAGYPVRGERNTLLVCCTELTSDADIDRYVSACSAVRTAVGVA